MKKSYIYSLFIVVAAIGLMVWHQFQKEIAIVNPMLGESEKIVYSSKQAIEATPNFNKLDFDGVRSGSLEEYLRKSLKEGGPEMDQAFMKLMLGKYSRGEKIGTLLALLQNSSGRDAEYILDLLSGLLPIEAAESLIAMLHKTNDGPFRAKILATLRSATEITSQPDIDFSSSKLTTAFENIQSAFREELISPNASSESIREAILDIPSVFPIEEAAQLLAMQGNKLQTAIDQGKSFPVEEHELMGLWVESTIGAVDQPELTEELVNFVRKNPDINLDEMTKARSIELISGIMQSGGEPQQFDNIVDIIKPSASTDSTFAKWTKLQAQIQGNHKVYEEALQSENPLEAAGIVLFTQEDFIASLPGETRKLIQQKLTESASNMSDEEQKVFLEQAIQRLDS